MQLVVHADLQQIELVCLGTTHFMNALIRHADLAQVAVLRLCGPATRALPPFCDMPPAFCAAIGQTHYMLPGTGVHKQCKILQSPCLYDIACIHAAKQRANVKRPDKNCSLHIACTRAQAAARLQGASNGSSMPSLPYMLFNCDVLQAGMSMMAAQTFPQ